MDADHPIPRDDVQLRLRGCEKWVHYHPKSSNSAGSNFLDIPIPLKPSGSPEAGTTFAAGQTTFQFEVPVPVDAHVSVMTGDWLPDPSRRDEDPTGDGLFVFYRLEARVHHRILGNTIQAKLVIVAQPSKLVGTLPGVRVEDEWKGVHASLQFQDQNVVAGGHLMGTWTVSNPNQLKLGLVRIGVARRIDVRDSDFQGGGWSERFWLNPEAAQEFGLPPGGSASGTFDVKIPDSFQNPRDDSGPHFRAYWTVFLAVPSLSRQIIGGYDSRWGRIIESRLTAPPTSGTPSPDGP